jgi:integrase
VYILLLGIAGGRPGESAGVHDTDIDAPARGMGEVRFTRTNRRGIDALFLDADDDPAWGPLKGRELADERVAPLPSSDAARIHQILRKSSATGTLFGGWDWDKFNRDVWIPAKGLLAARQFAGPGATKSERKEAETLRLTLGRLRLHDLRHAACSMWLNTPGMEIRVACEWSGHKRLSVFLDIYQGLMPGSQENAKANLDAAWSDDSRSGGID